MTGVQTCALPILSLSAHLLLLSSGSFFYTKTPEKKSDIIEVTYVLPEKMEMKVLTELPKKYELKKESLKIKSKNIPSDEYSSSEKGAQKVKGQCVEKNTFEELEEYIQYYELIREKIKWNITKYYGNSRLEGAVEAVFTLGKRGGLKNLSVSSNSKYQSEKLKKVALKSIRRSAPFPSFPSSLKKENLTFSVAIVIKKK